MQVKKINISGFRNIDNIEIMPDNQMNVIFGENAQGKTNILEALWLFTGAKSFRGSKEQNFIGFNKENAKNSLLFKALGVENEAQMCFGEKREAFLNGKKLSSPSSLAGSFNAVVFCPDDLSLVRDGPDKRRRFLDIAIGGLYPNYIEILRSYTRAVQQRNQIIKESRYDGSLSVMLDVFETEIADMGSKIIKYRNEYIKTLNQYVSRIYNSLSGGKEEMLSVYVANVCDIMLADELKKARSVDIYTGTTSVGPHRDDIEFNINGNSARSYGSQGQKRSVALSLKLAQAEVIKEISGEYPVCLLDDVMSELDTTRQNYILNHIRDWQSFITCCDPANVKELQGGKLIKVKNGKC